PHQYTHRHRIQQLAEPKEIKDAWNYSRRLVWGNQETIWILSPKTLTCQPNVRILDLAKPKKSFQRKLQHRPLCPFGCSQGSQVWARPSNIYDRMPSERILHLAEPKQYSSIYLEQRPRSSPLWTVSPSALSCKASQRLLDLSQPRSLSPSCLLPKEYKRPVSQAALIATASPRTHHLAQPIIKKSNPCYENRYMEAPIRKVNPAALQALATIRVTELARPKALPSASAPDRSAQWPVSRAALKAVASPRIGALAYRPGRASTNFVQFNPEAFVVKDAAKKAYCTDRLKKLAEPIMR
uniref:testicular haploid expressed gene protein-like n=1 Tax=Euleptes europaea TaxID=460621 RepID=UPI00254082CB